MKKEQGITMIALVITMILMLILAGVTLSSSKESLDETDSNAQIAELQTIQYAILEKYTTYGLTKNVKILETTNKLSYAQVTEVIDQINLKVDTSDRVSLMQTDYDVTEENYDVTDFYYEVTPEELKNIDIAKAYDTYIINYKTGEVINKTALVTKLNVPLYISIDS